MEQSSVFAPPSVPADFNKKDIPIKMGLIAGAISVFFTTVTNMFLLDNYFVFLGMSLVGFIVTVVMMILTAQRQRKAMGGFIEFKDAFQATFIMILIVVAITTIYGIIYIKFIDPDMYTRLKDGLLSFYEKMHMPEDKLDETVAKIDDQYKDSLKPLTLLRSVAMSIVFYSIFGMVAALIARKQKPVYLNN